MIDGDEVELKRVDYPLEETVAATTAVVKDELARHMLINIFRSGTHVSRFLRANSNGNGTAHPADATAEEIGDDSEG